MSFQRGGRVLGRGATWPEVRLTHGAMWSKCQSNSDILKGSKRTATENGG